jgi:hypothetical protein
MSLPKAISWAIPRSGPVSSIRPVWSKYFFICFIFTEGMNDTGGKFTLASLPRVSLKSMKILEKCDCRCQ